MAGYLTTAAAALLTNLQTTLQPLINYPDVDTTAPAADVANMAALVSNGPALASALAAFFSDYADAVIATLTATEDDTASSRGLPLPADYTYGLAAVAMWGNTLPPIAGTAPQAVQQQANQTALINLVQQLAVSAIIRIFSATQFLSADDADVARNQVMNLIDALSLNATDDGSYQAIIAAGQTVSSDLTTRGKQLPLVVEYQISAAFPALALAQRFYQDPARAGELIARNDPPCPLFMPAIVEALSV